MPSVLDRTRNLLDEARQDAAESAVPVRVAWAVATLPLAGGVVIAATVVHWPLFMWILREDHVVEWAQFALCLITSGVAALAAAEFARRREWLVATAFVLLCLGSFVLGAEEISWGQRAFAFATPDGMAAINDQEEFNVHNLTGAGIDVSQLFKVVELAMGLGGTVLPFLTRLPPPRLTGPLWRALSPPLFLVPLFAFAFAYRSFRFALHAIGDTPDAAVAFTEWAEVVLYLGLAGLAGFAYAGTRQRGGRHAPRDRAGRPLPHAPLDARVLGVVATAAAVTVVLAVLTMNSGILPGNV